MFYSFAASGLQLLDVHGLLAGNKQFLEDADVSFALDYWTKAGLPKWVIIINIRHADEMHARLIPAVEFVWSKATNNIDTAFPKRHWINGPSSGVRRRVDAHNLLSNPEVHDFLASLSASQSATACINKREPARQSLHKRRPLGTRWMRHLEQGFRLI